MALVLSALGHRTRSGRKAEQRALLRAVEGRSPMRLACASSAFDQAFERGDLTQLEFIDVCARELTCDGVVLDARHFPRHDNEYLAQLKKMATDLGVTIAAYADDAFFLADASAMALAIERAVWIGAPLLASRLARETASTWSEQLARISNATRLAKTANVTLAVRNAPDTFAATVHDCKRIAKEGDSAWLRFGLQPAALDAIDDPVLLRDNTVLLWADASRPSQRDRIEAFADFRGFLALDRADGAATPLAMRATIEERSTASGVCRAG